MVPLRGQAGWLTAVPGWLVPTIGLSRLLACPPSRCTSAAPGDPPSSPPQEPEGTCHLRQSSANGYHYHFPTACSDTQLALDFVLPTAGQGDVAVPGAFSLAVKLMTRPPPECWYSNSC